MIFNQNERIRKCRCDSTGHLVRRGIPVELPQAKVPSVLPLAELIDKEFARKDMPEYDVPGAAEEIAREAEKIMQMKEAGMRELPSASCLLVDSASDEAKKLYARSMAMYGILGSGI